MADQRWRACPGRLLVVLDGRGRCQAGQGDACRLLRPRLRQGDDRRLLQGHRHPSQARRQLDRPAADPDRGLPISQLLYAPSSPPASVAINNNLSNYHFGVGMAQAVLAVGIALAAVMAVLGGYRLLAPAGWRRIGGTSRG